MFYNNIHQYNLDSFIPFQKEGEINGELYDN